MIFVEGRDECESEVEKAAIVGEGGDDDALWNEGGSTCGDEIGGGGSVIEGGVIVVEG